MDKRIEQFLNEYNLTQYRDCFLHFDFATFLNLNIETISELIPSVSDCTTLQKALIRFINGSDDVDSFCVKTEDLSDNEGYEINFGAYSNETILPDFLEFIPREKRNSPELLQLEHPSLTITKIQKTDSVNENIIKQEEEDVEIIELISDCEPDVEDVSCNENSIDEDTIIVSAENARKQRCLLKRIINKMDLKTIRDLDMSILIAMHKKEKSFTDLERILLSEIIIKAILLHDATFTLEKAHFHKLAKLIVKTFPGERIRPYFKYQKHFNMPHKTDIGCLYAAFQKYQSILSISGYQNHNKIILGSTTSAQSKSKNEIDSIKTDVDLQYEFIRSRDERLELRNNMPSKHEKKFSTVKYVQVHKILQRPNGYELIMQDAEFLYPNLKGFVSNFGKIAFNIIEYAKGLVWANRYVIKLLRNAYQPISVDGQILLAILLLPYVLPKATIKHRKKSFVTTKLTTSIEFIRLFRNKPEETKIYGKIYQEDQKLLAGLLNVNLKLYGEFNNIYRIVLRVGTVDYEFKSPLFAIEAYFKMFLGMNLKYPISAQHIFYFFGIIAFNVETPKNTYHMYDCVVPFLKIFGYNFT